MKKPILARALALVMSLSLLSTTAFAAEAFNPEWHVGEDGSLRSHKEVSEDGTTFVESYDYYLTGDVTLDKTLVIKDKADASINLNGYTLSGNENSSVIKVTGEGTSLTLDDTKVEDTEFGGAGKITGGGGKAGGGIYIDDNATVTMNGGTIADNHVTENGGGVYMKDGGTFTMNDGAVLSRNEAGHSGGGVFVNNGYEGWAHSQFTMNGGVIIENEAGNGSTGAGGGIGAYGYQTAPRTEDAVTINGGEIKGNRVNFDGGNGGGIAVQNGAITMTGGTVSGNTGVNLGGGLYVYDSSANISGATFTGNSTGANAKQGLGGGIYLIGATGTIKETTVGGSIGTQQNNAQTGGGIYVGANSNITLDGNTISGNTASAGGGGVYAQNATVNVSGGSISGNTAATYGGGIYAGSSTVSVTGTDILHNTASTQWGGGVYAGGANTIVTLTDNTISGNDAIWGGGVGVYNSTVTVTNNDISGNNASTGGGIYAQGSTANVTMNSGNVTGNIVTGLGGGVRLHDKATFTMEGGSITGNTAATSGGGVYSYSGTTFTMNGGEISGNHATKGNGGGLYNHTANFVMNGGKLYGNTAATSSDDIYSNIKDGGSISLITASEMGAEIDGEEVSRWLWDASNARWQNGYYFIPSLTANATLCLKAAPAQFFTVTYTDGNGATLQTDSVENGSKLPAAPTPVREGYTFTGWSMELPETAKSDLTLVAQWEAVIPPVNPENPGESEEPENPENPENPGESEEPGTPEEPGVTIPDADVPLAGAPDAGEALSIEDEEVPLAGIVTLAELLAELREHEEIPEAELPEDFKFIDHDYAQAIYWALAEQLVEDTEDDPLDPDELVTAGLLREVLERFVAYYKGCEDFVVTVEGEDDELIMDLGERLTAFYAELEEYEAEAEAA